MSEEYSITVRGGTRSEVIEMMRTLLLLHPEHPQPASAPIEKAEKAAKATRASKVAEPLVVSASIEAEKSVVASPAPAAPAAPLTPAGTSALDTIKALMPIAVEKKSRAAVIDLMKKYGATKSSEIKASDYVAITAELNAMTV